MTDRIAGDDVRTAMCIRCAHCYKRYDGLQCDLDPHGNCEKHKGVVDWLLRPYFRTCPEFKEWKMREETVETQKKPEPVDKRVELLKRALYEAHEWEEGTADIEFQVLAEITLGEIQELGPKV